MRKILVLFMLSLAVCMVPLVQAEDNQLDLNVIPFHIGTTIAGTGANSGIYRVPQACKINSIYITDLSGVAADGTDYINVKLFKNNVAYGTFTSSDTAIVAVTPILLTPTGTSLAAGDILQIQLSKVGSGKATTNMGVTLAYHNAN